MAHYLVLTKLDRAEGALPTIPEPPPPQPAKPGSASRKQADLARREAPVSQAPGQAKTRVVRGSAARSDAKSKAGTLPSGQGTKGVKRRREPTSRPAEEANGTVQTRSGRAKAEVETGGGLVHYPAL